MMPLKASVYACQEGMCQSNNSSELGQFMLVHAEEENLLKRRHREKRDEIEGRHQHEREDVDERYSSEHEQLKERRGKRMESMVQYFMVGMM